MKKILYISLIVTIVFILNSRVNAWSKYEVGKEVTYNDISFYVIEDSDENTEIVKLLKKEALSKDEIDKLNISDIDVLDKNGYGLVQFGESLDYNNSIIKKVVDAWKTSVTKNNDFVRARLLAHDDLVNNLGYINSLDTSKTIPSSDGDTPEWIYNSNYTYWTMSDNGSTGIWIIYHYGSIGFYPCNRELAVRPVLEIKKSALGDTNIIDDDTNENEDIDKDDKSNAALNNSNKESKVSVNVPNTMQKVSIILIMTGIILITISIIFILKNKDKLNK